MLFVLIACSNEFIKQQVHSVLILISGKGRIRSFCHDGITVAVRYLFLCPTFIQNTSKLYLRSLVFVLTSIKTEQENLHVSSITLKRLIQKEIFYFFHILNTHKSIKTCPLESIIF